MSLVGGVVGLRELTLLTHQPPARGRAATVAHRDGETVRARTMIAARWRSSRHVTRIGLAWPDERARFLIRYAGSFAPWLVARGEGAWVETTDGPARARFHLGADLLDARAQPPAVVEAVKRAADDLLHLNSWMLSEPVLALAERLVAVVPPPLEG
jgi:4-aminobutyrate aminotransferase-like enzyme